MFKISASAFGTMVMYRRFHTFAYEFLATATKGVVHIVHVVVIWLSFGVIWQYKGSGGTWTFCHYDTRLHMNLKRYLKDRGASRNTCNCELHYL